jgi:mannosyltransferase OCH1-like enzyme
MIPRYLLQTWETHDVPIRWQAGPESFKRLHPHWRYTLLDKEERIRFLGTYFPELVPVLSAYPHAIQHADLIRYAWLYVNGGVYSDLKNIFRRCLDAMFAKEPHRDLYICRSGMTGTPSNYFLASRPRHPFWLDCLRDIHMRKGRTPIYVQGKHLTVMYTTGPWLLDRILNSRAYQGNREQILLPRSFQPCGACEKNCLSKEREVGGSGVDVWFTPLAGKSWNSWDSEMMNLVYCNRHVIVYLLGILLIVLSIKRKSTT